MHAFHSWPLFLVAHGFSFTGKHGLTNTGCFFLPFTFLLFKQSSCKQQRLESMFIQIVDLPQSETFYSNSIECLTNPVYRESRKSCIYTYIFLSIWLDFNDFQRRFANHSLVNHSSLVSFFLSREKILGCINFWEGVEINW